MKLMVGFGVEDGKMANSEHQRNTRIDAVRAVALGVVIIMNMMTLSGLAYLSPDVRADMLGPLDIAAWNFLAVFFDGKALAAFSFMFGLSFSIILQRIRPEGETSILQLLRRFLVLAALGAFNAVFLFWADILMTYAALGLLLPFAARLSQRVTVSLGTVLILAGPVALALSNAGPPVPVPEGRYDSLEAFASPNYVDAVSQNLSMVTGATDAATGMLLLRLFMLSGLFLLGLAVGRSSLPSQFFALRGVMVRAGALCLAVGLAAGLALRWIEVPQGIWFGLYLETPLMALGYLMLLTAALHGPTAGWVHRTLAPLGRMSLTGYLTSSAIGQALFYGWGLQLIGQTGTLAVVALALGVVAVLVAFAHLWFRY
ncbi:MAG: DUF418 domain-containing protein, partial [Roseinatronobacter sp.]